MASTELTVKITPNDKGNPPGKLADAELHFTGGPLDGLKLIGFAIWERRGGAGRNVTFPARQYTFDHIPSSKWGVIPLASKFAAAGRSVAIFTEALGAHPHHGHVVLLVDVPIGRA